MKLTCKHCDRYLGEVEVIVGELLCGNTACKGGSQYSIITNNLDKIVRHKFLSPERPPKTKEIK